MGQNYYLTDSVRSLNVHIESTQEAKRLPIRHVANLLDQLQTTVYHIGDSMAGGDFRIRGHPQDAIIDSCELVIQDVKKGSLNFDLTLQDQQTTLTGASLGEIH